MATHFGLPFKGVIHEATASIHNQGPVGERREPCSDFELNAAECIEAYGVTRGSDLCYKFFEDIIECKSMSLRRARYHLIMQERAKKLLTGKLSWSEKFGKPYPYDSFVYGVFTP